MKPRVPPLQSIRLLDQVLGRICYLHYSLKNEKAYLTWTLLFDHSVVNRVQIVGGAVSEWSS